MVSLTLRLQDAESERANAVVRERGLAAKVNGLVGFSDLLTFWKCPDVLIWHNIGVWVDDAHLGVGVGSWPGETGKG